jgi:hypothetical protein
LQEIAGKYEGVYVIDVVPSASAWSDGLSENGVIMYSDDHHLNRAGAKELAKHAIETGRLSWIKEEPGLGSQ